MTIEIPEQPMPAALAEACELLSAAERHDGDPTSSAAIRAAGAAGDALEILVDVKPRYAPFDDTAQPQPLSDVEQTVRGALARASADATSPEEILRIARACRALDEPRW